MRSNIDSYCRCFLVLAAGLLLVSCDESLPPRDMQNLNIQADLSIIDTLVTIATHPGGFQEIVGSGGSVVVSVTSYHDEVLEGKYEPEGQVEVWLDKDPSLRTHLSISHFEPENRDIIRNGVLTILPGQTVQFRMKWSHRTDGGEKFWMQGKRTLVIPPIGYSYYETEPLHFRARGSARLFGEVGAIYLGELRFRLTYRDFWVAQ